MSVEAMVWVLRNSQAKLGARLTLLALADFAHPDGSEAYPSVDTIAKHANISRRSVQMALRSLEEDGMIRRDGIGRNGTACWRVVMGGADSAPRADCDAEGRNSRREGGAKSAPNPSTTTVKDPSTKGSARERAREAAQHLPDDFPAHLKPHARRVFAVLRDVAEQHNAREVTPRGVGLAIQGHPARRFVEVAYELASWAQAPPRPVRDVVGTYRTFLARADTYAGVEQFDAPAVAAAAPNVHHIRGNPITKAGRVDWGQVAETLEAQGL